ncbi:MAG: hypothetical protein HRT71_19400 [Flavobacteriales bacterium]|nr:hypothetical protein [Flavobacteriales bacterium]
MKLLSVFLIVVATVGISIFSSSISNISIDELGVSWTFSFLLPRLLILATSIALAINCWQLLNKKKKAIKISATIVAALLFPGIQFALNPIYEGDLSKTDRFITEDLYKENSITSWINESDKNFNGLVCIASPTCPHCMVAVSKLSRSLARTPDKKHIVFMFAKDEERIESFKKAINVDNINFELMPDQQGMLELCGGAFPTFLYFKENRFVHRWSNNNFGYSAFDWVENDLE